MTQDRVPLRVASHLAPDVQPLYEFLAEYLAARLGRRPEFVVATSYERCAQDIDDVCFVCSVPYLLFSKLGRMQMEVVAAPVLMGDRYAGAPVYFSDVVVRADSPYQRFEDLRGARWAYNEPFSHSGYLVVLHHLLSMGETAAFFGEMVEAGFHEEALRMVAAGVVDGAAIDSQVLGIQLRTDPELAGKVRTIGAIGPSTIQPVVASASRLTSAERQSIADALLSVGDEPAARPIMDAAQVERFAALDSGAYADIRTMLGRVRDAGMLDGAWDKRWTAETGLPSR